MRETKPLRHIRRTKDITQEQLARIVGVDQTTISDIELGRNANPSWAIVKRIADALGVQPEDVFPVEPKEPA